ncbi:MAG: hypothetical protein H8M99_07105 [Gloeobacteraceae cyanobacterium ES-bin-144]|nr:hypothetical protein [Verrucomicrobiales bacterium]
MKPWFLLAAAAFVLTSCEYTEVQREIGYKGKARINPWLAAEKFTQKMGWDTRSEISWSVPDWEDAVWVIPASILSNESFVRQARTWVRDGGHLILMIEHADAETNDWSEYAPSPELEPPLYSLLKSAHIDLTKKTAGAKSTVQDRVVFEGLEYDVKAESDVAVSVGNKDPGVFASVKDGEGRLTVITDGRIFRNRWISDHDHAALLAALLESTEADGIVGFMRGASLSIWAMLRQYLWPVLIGICVTLFLWLWKNLKRFGPVEDATAPSELRGYEHHLEALGHFQWRLDRAGSLLVPLRTKIIELGQHASVRTGCRDMDFFQYLADRADLPRDRVLRALAEAAPSDPAILTRTTTDLQQLLKVLNNSSMK